MSGTSPGDNKNASNHSARTGLAGFVVVLSFFPLGLFAISQLGRYLFLAELVGNFRVQMMVLLLPFPFLLWRLRRPKWGMVLAVATVWSIISVMLIYLPGDQPPVGPSQIRLMSFNVWTYNLDHQNVIQIIEQEDPDILAVLEFSDRWPKVLQYFDRRYPYQILEPRWHGFGIAIFSKYPFENTEVCQLARSATDSPAIIGDVNVGGQKLRVAGLHVLSPMSLNRLKIRNNQLAEMSALLSQNEKPTIVLGDFNCTPSSPFLRDFLKTTGYRDSRQGFGVQPSWHADYWPLRIPIDHAFVSKHIHVHDRRLGKNSGSDHFPLIIDVSISGDGAE